MHSSVCVCGGGGGGGVYLVVPGKNVLGGGRPQIFLPAPGLNPIVVVMKDPLYGMNVVTH